MSAVLVPSALIAGSVVAAALLARRPGIIRWSLAVAVLVGAAVAGGIFSGPLANDLLFWLPQLTDNGRVAAILGVQALAFLVCCAFPAWAGVFAGRRVTFGTGWISAGVVAGSVAVAVQQILQGLR